MRFYNFSMRRWFPILIVLLVFGAFASAQTPTVAVRVQWDAPAAADGVTGHTLTIDGGTPIAVPLSACSTTTCEQATTVSPGSHTFSVTATNQWGTSVATVVTVPVGPPAAPKNLRIVK